VPKGVRGSEKVTVADVVVVHRQSKTLLGILEKEADLLDRAEVDPVAKIELDGAIKAIETEIRIPKARTMMIAALTRGMTKDLVLTLYHRAVTAMHALAPIVAIKLAEKLDDHQSPGSTRVLIEMAKGLGLFVPAEPMKAQARADMMSEGELKQRSDDSLKEDILDFS